ncbi:MULTISPECIES: uracil phosphoribosyltransferase [Anaerococcus]|jgi:uracil phosphoribosyltransferase|uniref:Uracil phosphoribosyltransferase n=1 Tax=Anaerococcus octavius TaxID=54007 RepID=A0A2I1MAJ0_9FIRM|nr:MULTISPECIES: uracil phosphoribosyltransferase [Anaerococcus]MBS6106584.1 uracil phosphoribosyltransferase [Anaerococcus sp.]MDU2599138.1 uracil phosphoribosyltransferase [Anaerococcus sp.]MDU3177289.1 uracil phosphoribosyltransferase [Anaerococcus sp.]MDU4026512.1 uracil phosphoribosyltransferase [Anaerococcus sp.]MDU5228802.1 uracil phosphoribosyltransferase [Anaerococcus sp.]
MQENVHVLDHPVIKHKISILRDSNTGATEFRSIIKEISIILAYEATKDLELEEYELETPIAKTTGYRISGKKLGIVPILRAGLGMVDGVLEVLPAAKIGHIGMYRDEETLLPVEYYSKLPKDVENRDMIVVDPMLATGGSACDAIGRLKEKGCKDLKLLSIIAAPEGVEKLQKEHPDVDIYIAQLDKGLNEDSYIVPGLGDAGDRLFGTK